MDVMISYKGYESVIQRVYDSGQEHIFRLWNDLRDHEKKELLDDAAGIDFKLLDALYRGTGATDLPDRRFDPAPYISLPGSAEEEMNFKRAREAGEEHIREGRVAAFVVAGGQGTRLGFDGPKGIFPIGPVSGASLFQIFAEKLVKYRRKYGAAIPLLIMTSESNHRETVSFMGKNRYFGLDEKDVLIFPQGMVPSLDLDGKLILETPGRIFRNPDGHGGSLGALRRSGALEKIEGRGISTISYFQVDNPLVKIVDPVFIGFHVLNEADASSKGLEKAYPGEKIGVFVRFANGPVGVVEYSDLPPELQQQREADGRLRFRIGSIAIHLFSLGFIRRITGDSSVSLPYHTAKKKIRAYTHGGIGEIEGYKFEKFVFDALPLTEKNVILEIDREEEFAPVKNRDGVDSVHTSQELMMSQSRRWCASRGIKVPDRVKRLEISPLAAVGPEDLPDSLSLPRQDVVYLREAG